MKKSLVSGSLLLCIIVSTAQNKTAADYAPLITPTILKSYLTVLTSDEFAGRETSTPGEQKAADYVAAQWKSFGLKSFSKTKNYLQKYPVVRDSMTTEQLTFGNNVYTVGPRFAMGTNASFSKKVKANELVFVGYGISDSAYDDYNGKDVKGKIVVIASGEPMNADSTYLLSGTRRNSSWTDNKKNFEAKSRGAKAIITFSTSPEISDIARRFLTRNALKYNPIKLPLNVATVSQSVMDSLFGKEVFGQIWGLAKNKKFLNGLTVKPVLVKTTLEYEEDIQKRKANNVIGYIKGSEKPDEYVFLTAHMDHLGADGKNIYHGADDDGSGTSSVIAAANAFSAAYKEGNGPKRSIIFMTVSGEEKGLWGSEYATSHPVVDLDNVSADINIDMVGRIDPKRKNGDSLNYVYAVGSDKISTEMKPLMEKINKATGNLELDYKFDDPRDRERIYFRSDHYNFAKNGVPIVFLYNGSHPDYHRITDTIDKINFELMAKRAKLAFNLAWELANRDSLLTRDLPIPTATR